MLQKIISFGFKHGAPNAGPGEVIVDIRRLLNNPYHMAHLRELPGTHPQIATYIERTHNFQEIYNHIWQQIVTPGTQVAYIGCTGGRHRSVYLANRIGQELGVKVEHRDANTSS